MTLIYGSRTPDMLIYVREYDDWRHAQIEVQTTVDRADLGWTGNVGVVPLLLDRLHPLAAERTVVLTCGPDVMMRFVVRSAIARHSGRAHLDFHGEKHAAVVGGGSPRSWPVGGRERRCIAFVSIVSGAASCA